MGTWGVAILSDDFAADVYGEYMERYDDGEEHAVIREYLERDNAEALDDEDERPVFYYALAKAQWECGALETNVLQRVRDQIASGDGLECWEEDGASYLKKRKDALDKFLVQINTPKAKPRKRRKIRHAPASYQPGDCLAIKLDDGDYGAALVLATDSSAREEDYSLVVVLKYKSTAKPHLSDFDKRQWLCPDHHSWDGQEPAMHWAGARGFKADKEKLEVVGRIELREDDPKTCGTFSGWALGIQVMNQDKWDRGERD
jgi:hypothetical protein